MRIIPAALLLIFSCRLLAQTSDTSTGKESIHFVLSPGVSYQKEFLGEVNFYFAKIGDDVCNGCSI
jgi:hypothetical protein